MFVCVKGGGLAFFQETYCPCIMYYILNFLDLFKIKVKETPNLQLFIHLINHMSNNVEEGNLSQRSNDSESGQNNYKSSFFIIQLGLNWTKLRSSWDWDYTDHTGAYGTAWDSTGLYGTIRECT